MKTILNFIILTAFSMTVCITTLYATPKNEKKWISIHLLDYTTDSLLEGLAARLPQLTSQGINMIFLEVDYNFDFKSHPELRDKRYITKEGAQKFGLACRQANIRLVPQFQSLGHQSRDGVTCPLLAVYPELDNTPGAFPNNVGIYCREWDPTNPKVNEIVFPLIDEIADAFGVDGIHVGMDEVFLLNSDKAPNTKGKDPAKLFAKVVNEFHDHLVKKRKLEMFMWADRLIDGKKYNFGEWESSLNGTAPAVDMIPKDIILCDWHYEPADEYGSVAMFIHKGFRVIPSSWRKTTGVEALIKYSYKLNNPKMIGHMFTTWHFLQLDSIATYRPLVAGISLIKSGKFYDVSIKSKLENRALKVSLACGNPQLKITYTLDGSEPTAQSVAYSKPFILRKTALLRALAFQGNEPMGSANEKQFTVNFATGRPIKLLSELSNKYRAEGGVNVLVNGANGSGSYGDGQWLAFEGNNMEVVIDLGKRQSISNVILHSNNNPGNLVFPSERVEVYTSDDGKPDSFKKAGESITAPDKSNIVASRVSFDTTPARFIKVKAFHKTLSNPKDIPWLFVDEIIVE
ncbi:MAG: chitobiase/beta-hexosaminidase C-terminal domain-containing protein [Bacteroidetes bacterium]|nr:chitobiase/beta-hexosaminidase C-terminal domain-containing protein [Bacteroidota bacterium]MBS1633045.1 chitobiase/beta-hexosaminidase C-terminal domain-containing protein [Bacteroidota bacterium]